MKNAVFWAVAPCSFVWTDVSEDHIASSLQLLAHAGSLLADSSTLKMEAIRSSKTLVYTKLTPHHIPEKGILQLCICLIVFKNKIFVKQKIMRSVFWGLCNDAEWSCLPVHPAVKMYKGCGGIDYWHGGGDNFHFSPKHSGLCWVHSVSSLLLTLLKILALSWGKNPSDWGLLEEEAIFRSCSYATDVPHVMSWMKSLILETWFI
jgi:hypothetical protein